MRLAAGLGPDPLRELQRSPRVPDSLAAIAGGVVLLRGRQGREGGSERKGEGKGYEKGKEGGREGRGR